MLRITQYFIGAKNNFLNFVRFGSPPPSPFSPQFAPLKKVDNVSPGTNSDIAGDSQSIVAVGFAWDPQPTHAVIATRHPGEEWSYTRLFDPDFLRLFSVAWTGERFVVVGNQGRTLTSTDGDSWATTILDQEITLRRIAWNGDRLVAVGGSTVATNRDGIDWEFFEVPDAGFDDITWTGRQFVAAPLVIAGRPGIITSRDGISWKQEPTGYGFPARCVEGDGAEIIISGSLGRILRADHVSTIPRRADHRVVPVPAP